MCLYGQRYDLISKYQRHANNISFLSFSLFFLSLILFLPLSLFFQVTTFTSEIWPNVKRKEYKVQGVSTWQLMCAKRIHTYVKVSECSSLSIIDVSYIKRLNCIKKKQRHIRWFIIFNNRSGGPSFLFFFFLIFFEIELKTILSQRRRRRRLPQW